jgi:hypothetical protein
MTMFFLDLKTHSYGKSSFFIDKSTISMAMFYSSVKLPEGTHGEKILNMWQDIATHVLFGFIKHDNGISPGNG